MSTVDLHQVIRDATRVYREGIPGPVAINRSDFIHGLYDGVLECAEHVKWWADTNIPLRAGWQNGLLVELRDLSKRFRIENDYHAGLLDGYDLVCHSIARALGLTL
jgi:hypothetical protein